VTALKWCLLAFGLVLPGLSGCGPSNAPDAYVGNAVLRAAKVERGMVVGVRRVGVSTARLIATASGGAGGIAGAAAEQASADTAVSEYIVRKPNGDLISVIQTDKMALVLGQRVLLVAGDRAHLMPDRTEPPELSPTPRLDSSN